MTAIRIIIVRNVSEWFYFRYSWRHVLLINENDSYSEVFGKQSCGLMTKTMMEMFKRNDTYTNITYNVFDLSKNKHNSMTENLRNEAGSKHASKCICSTFIYIGTYILYSS